MIERKNSQLMRMYQLMLVGPRLDHRLQPPKMGVFAIGAMRLGARPRPRRVIGDCE
jgi:hypothetical protein